MIKKYKKKPVVIEAIQLTKDNFMEVLAWVEGAGYCNYDMTLEGMNIPTLEGLMLASFGDYVIKGIKGEFYPCKPDIFQMTYEEFNNA